MFILFSSFVFACCSNPADIDVKRTLTTSYLDNYEDDPRFDTLTANVNATIRFEASVDTSKIFFERFTGTGLRISLLAIHPDSSVSEPFLNIYSVSANYLDLPATGLPLRVQIPPEYFRRYTNARLATALIVLYEDANRNNSFDPQERIFGTCEQQLFGLAEGKRLDRIPALSFADVHEGPNVFVRAGQQRFPNFKAAPDYTSTIFIIQVRGPLYPYNFPYPWPTHVFLTP